MRRSLSVNATYDGVVRAPWSFAMISTLRHTKRTRHTFVSLRSRARARPRAIAHPPPGRPTSRAPRRILQFNTRPSEAARTSKKLRKMCRRLAPISRLPSLATPHRARPRHRSLARISFSRFIASPPSFASNRARPRRDRSRNAAPRNAHRVSPRCDRHRASSRRVASRRAPVVLPDADA